MLFRAEGESGTQGGPSGDLYVFISVKDHPVFERSQSDLHTVLPVTFTQATLGDEVEVPTLSGEKHHITLPEGTQPGTTFRVPWSGNA